MSYKHEFQTVILFYHNTVDGLQVFILHGLRVLISAHLRSRQVR